MPPSTFKTDTELYEELRKMIDGGSESMTHEDALQMVQFWKSNDAASGVQILTLQGRIRHLEGLLKTRDAQIKHLTNANKRGSISK